MSLQIVPPDVYVQTVNYSADEYSDIIGNLVTLEDKFVILLATTRIFYVTVDHIVVNTGVNGVLLSPPLPPPPITYVISVAGLSGVVEAGELADELLPTGRFFDRNENLADILDTNEARLNLGLGEAATRPLSAFDVAGAAAEAQDASLQKSSNLADVFDPDEARTNLGLGTAATHDVEDFVSSGDVLLASLNLSDLDDVSEARINLGLGSAATHNYTDFEPAGTSSASALQKSANLSDLTDVPAARTNLGLGSIATHGASEYETVANFNADADARIAVAAGVSICPLSGGFVPSIYLPSFVDDVLEYANLAAFPGTGETGKMYVALDTGLLYRWSGSAYINISGSPGTTDDVVEGAANLYFTVERAQDAIGSALSNSSTLSWTYDDSGNNISAAVTNSPLLGGQNSAYHLDRANHTGTQLAATISDFAATVRGTVLTGLDTGTSTTITASDSVLSGFGKVQAQVTSHVANVSNPHNVTLAQVGGAASGANSDITSLSATTSITTALLSISGNRNVANIASAGGATLRGVASAYTDTASSGTVATNFGIYQIAAPTVAASSATTFSGRCSTLHIAGPVVAGTNVTLSVPRSLYVASGTAEFAGAIATTGTVSINNASSATVSIGTSTATGSVTIGGGSNTITHASPTIFSGSYNTPAISTQGGPFQMPAATYTDSTSSGTVATDFGVTYFGIPTIAASSATTFSGNIGTLTIMGAPAAGTNVTLSGTAKALHVIAGGARIMGSTILTGGTIQLNNNSNNPVQMGTGSSTGAITIGGGSNTVTLGSPVVVNPGGGQSLDLPNVASAVNYVRIVGSVTTAGPTISSQGSDTNVALNFSTKGTGVFDFFTNTNVRQFQIANVASAVNYAGVQGSATGQVPYFFATGSDTNVGMNLSTKGSGNFNFQTNTIVTQFRIIHTASAVNIFSAAGGATGNAASLQAIGTDTNVDAQIKGQGTGLVKIGLVSTGTSSAGAITANNQRAVITTESLTTAAGADYTLTWTNSFITTASLVMVTLGEGSNTRGIGPPRVTVSSGSVTIKVRNIETINAFNGTILFHCIVL